MTSYQVCVAISLVATALSRPRLKRFAARVRFARPPTRRRKSSANTLKRAASLTHSQKVRTALAPRVGARAASILLTVFFSSIETAVLVGLYEEPERPPNAVDYIKRYMGAPTGVDVESIKAENDSLKRETKELKEQIKDLNARLEEK